jgi:hypothetical protein
MIKEFNFIRTALHFLRKSAQKPRDFIRKSAQKPRDFIRKVIKKQKL